MSKIGYWNAVISTSGQGIPATITVYIAGTTTLATLYANAEGTLIKDNPFQTDNYGRFQFFADAGKYDIEVSGEGITTFKINNVSLTDITLFKELTDTPESYTGAGGKLIQVKSTEDGLEFYDKIGCSVYMSADQSIPDSTQTVLAFDSVKFDYGSGWDTTNYKWTAPKAGLIIAIAKITTYTDWSGYGTAYLRIRKNGEVVAQTRPFKYAALVTAVLEVNQGDTIDFSVMQNSGASVNIRSDSYRTYANIYMIWHE